MAFDININGYTIDKILRMGFHDENGDIVLGSYHEEGMKTFSPEEMEMSSEDYKKQ